MSRPPDYGIIYNWDGAPHGYHETPQTMEQFLDAMYAPMEDTQVGAHFWSMGQHNARYDSEVIERIGESTGRRYPSAHAYTFAENVLGMIERGEDPQAAAIQRGHELGMHVYASVRMNDNHFNGMQVEDMPESKHGDLTRMRREHPEWLLGDGAQSDWFALSWNMAVPEVRKHRYENIRELCRKWQWDGVELDWQRHGYHLHKDYGYKLRYALTDLQRSIREMANRLADERGRPFYVAARVSGTLEMCKRIGYDIQAWVEEGLVDIIIPAASSGTDPLLAIDEFKTLTAGTDIAVYGCIYGGADGPYVGPEPEIVKRDMLLGGIASRHYAHGADGIYVFNFHADREYRRRLLTTIGSADTLRRVSKIYAATHKSPRNTGDWRGAELNDRIYAEVPTPLVHTTTGDGPSVPLMISDDFSADPPQNIELRIRLEEWVVGDVVEVTWNGHALPAPRIAYTDVDSSTGYEVSSAVWQSYVIRPQDAPSGPHTVKVILRDRNPRLVPDLILTDVELVVDYGNA